MFIEITEPQASFYTKNGYLELEGISIDPAALFEIAKKGLSSRLQTPKISLKTPLERFIAGRDLWRIEPALESLWLRKLAPLALTLSGKDKLRLACDQWFPSDLTWDKKFPIKELFSIQGIAICALISAASSPHPVRSDLGLLPLPSKPGNVLFFRADLLLDWPSLAKSSPTDLYLCAFGLPNSVYIQNPKDPLTHMLKQFGYNFNDLLKNEFHPLIIK